MIAVLYTSRTYIEEALEIQNELLRIHRERMRELSAYSRYRLERKDRNGNSYYTKVDRMTGRKEYLGGGEHPVVRAIMEYRYCEELVSRIRQNIAGLEGLLSVYLDNRVTTVQEILPKAYRGDRNSALFARESFVENWLREGRAFKEQVGIPFKSDLKVHAFDGSLQRSRLETLHYEAFHIYGIPCLYERPLAYLGGDHLEYLFPDFTLLDPYTLNELLFECLGYWYHSSSAKRRSYRQDTLVRFDKYEKLGFTRSHNLLVFSEGPDGFIDLSMMHRQIRALAQPPPSPEILRGLNDALR